MRLKKTIAVSALVAVVLVVLSVPTLARARVYNEIGACGLGLSNQRYVIGKASKILGMSQEDVCEAKRDGKTLADLAMQEGVTVDALVVGIVEDIEEEVEELKAEDLIDEKTAKEMLENVETNVRTAVERNCALIGQVTWGRRGRAYGRHQNNGYRNNGQRRPLCTS